MVDLTTVNEWQHRDPFNGLVMPWYTKPALDEICTWHLDDKWVLEVGGGASTLWWNAKAQRVITLETNDDYIHAIEANPLRPLSVVLRFDGLDMVQGIADSNVQNFDIAIIDGAWRDECVPHCIKILKPGGKLIIDNWDQEEVWIPLRVTRRLLRHYPFTIYPQERHPHWKTAIFTIQ